ncbi:MAG: hypothetical protein SW833_17920 [Cyanobacteriota bacterium]|nr:hypothetical protein [Cyanobacteriota bacterium]
MSRNDDINFSQSFIGAITVTVIGGLIVGYILPEGRFEPTRSQSSVTSPSNPVESPDFPASKEFVQTPSPQRDPPKQSTFQTSPKEDVSTPQYTPSIQSPSRISSVGVAIVFDPPSNVRKSPNGEILCSVRERATIDIHGSSGSWYYTDVCEEMGMIHSSQITFESN